MVVAGAAEASILVFATFSTIFSTEGLGAGAAAGAGAGGGPWLGVGALTWSLLGVAGACPRGLTPGFESLPELVLPGVPDGGAPLSLLLKEPKRPLFFLSLSPAIAVSLYLIHTPQLSESPAHLLNLECEVERLKGAFTTEARLVGL